MFGKWFLAAISIGTFGSAYIHAGEQDNDRELVAIVEANDRYFQALQSWEGVGDLKEVFTVDRKTLSVADLKPEPVRVERLSKIRFVWSVPLNSVRALATCVPPTKLFQSDSATELVEDLQINCLIRPDGFYRFEPNLAFSDFKGYPQFGKITRVLEKRTLIDAERARTYSYLFDPQTVFEIHGNRINARLKRLREKLDKGMASIDVRGPLVTIIETYKNAGSPDLRIELVLDRLKGYLPVRCSSFMGNEVSETSEWEYADVDGIKLPTSRHVKKFNNGVFSSSRSISILENSVNKNFTEDDFSFASIGVKDGDRLIEREAKKMYLFEGGKQNELTTNTKMPTKLRWLVAGNLLAVVLLVVAFRSRAKKA